jgi:threonine/homoserine/homoserine lactone efflux protein
MIPTLITIFWLSFVWAMSPWPDLVVVTKNTIAHWRIHGFATAIWIALALFTYGILATTWIWALIQDTPQVFMIIKIAWALYLAYLWYMLLQSKQSNHPQASNTPLNTPKTQSLFSSCVQGYLTNIGNPKVIVFIVAVFSQLLWSQESFTFIVLSAWAIACSAVIWFGLVSCLIWQHWIQSRLKSHQWIINRVFWALLLLLASAVIIW